MKSKKSLLRLLKITPAELDELVTHTSSYHYRKKLPKPDGTNRKIDPSTGLLKVVQERIFNWLKRSIPRRFYQMGGYKGNDNIKNARYHQGNKFFFNTDLRKFYDKVTARQVNHMFLRIGCSPTVAHYLTRLTTYKGRLGQGGHAATIIANLVFVPCGDELYSWCLERGFKFTTYIDDIVISSPHDFKSEIPDILSILDKHGFIYHPAKTSYRTVKSDAFFKKSGPRRTAKAQKEVEVTGVVLRNNGLRPPQRIIEKQVLSTYESSAFKGRLNYVKRINSAPKYEHYPPTPSASSPLQSRQISKSESSVKLM